MAESLGFVIGTYTISQDVPILYITDSNNARTLQRNVKNQKDFTHRKPIRCIKQGIDHSIANHLEYLTSQWLWEDQVDENMQRLYRNGEETCKRWALRKSPIAQTAHDDEDVLSTASHIESHADDVSLPSRFSPRLLPWTMSNPQCLLGKERIATTSTHPCMICLAKIFSLKSSLTS